jgi:hypothetical protein
VDAHYWPALLGWLVGLVVGVGYAVYATRRGRRPRPLLGVVVSIFFSVVGIACLLGGRLADSILFIALAIIAFPLEESSGKAQLVKYLLVLATSIAGLLLTASLLVKAILALMAAGSVLAVAGIVGRGVTARG